MTECENIYLYKSLIVCSYLFMCAVTLLK
uniref:Uncharacterized protein n=1 Tax=Anguilla anguilla TaxID=7936 RepID=A0A0E9VFP0_ANGAN